jgi:small-conductance mechanosensitive channel
VLLEVAERNPLCLEEPAPLILFQGYGDSSINHQFSVWAKTDHYLDLRNSIPLEIKEAFDDHGIEIPFPHRTLYAGAETDAFPVTVVDPSDRPPEASSPENPVGESDGGSSADA